MCSSPRTTKGELDRRCLATQTGPTSVIFLQRGDHFGMYMNGGGDLHHHRQLNKSLTYLAYDYKDSSFNEVIDFIERRVFVCSLNCGVCVDIY